jgi:uncharacterized protein YggU (UPF0235/DUF167 family)
MSVEAHPNARVARLELVDTILRVWVRPRATDGQANEAIKQAIADALGLRNAQVQLQSGARQKRKIFDIDVADLAELQSRLARKEQA